MSSSDREKDYSVERLTDGGRSALSAWNVKFSLLLPIFVGAPLAFYVTEFGVLRAVIFVVFVMIGLIVDYAIRPVAKQRRNSSDDGSDA